MATVYEIITERILAELEKGTAPWHKPWKSVDGEEPANLSSHAAYRGINRFLLAQAHYDRPLFVTYNQAAQLGGTVKKGEHGFPVIFWKRNTYTKTQADGSETEENGFVLRYYTVFNIAQTEGLEKWIPAKPTNILTEFERHVKADAIVNGYKSAPGIRHQLGNRAYYVPSQDVIVMPEAGQFASQAEYYSTLFHELTHSTGHETRLKRPTLTEMVHFGDTNYSKEELVAEMGAAFLCGESGIENEAALKNSASYIDGWRKRIKQDSNLVIQAAAQAQKAADWILQRNRA